MQDIDLFFEDPSEYHPPPRSYGNLYLLRRDVDHCLGIHRKGINGAPPALFLGVAGILAGIDLLAKFFVGEDGTGRGEVADRFQKYVQSHFDPSSKADASAIWHFRNSILHSYGLYGRDKHKEYHFIPAWASGALMRITKGDVYVISCITLWQQFEQSIAKFHRSLVVDGALQENFQRMFPKYGSVYLTVANEA